MRRSLNILSNIRLKTFLEIIWTQLYHDFCLPVFVEFPQYDIDYYNYCVAIEIIELSYYRALTSYIQKS